MDWKRLGEAYPDSTLFGDGPTWTDVEQGYAGTCYILASMGSLTEFPSLIKDVFITDTTNDAGIYALRFFIRGKPWIITIDDEMLFFRDNLNFATVGDNSNLWAPLVEKAFAKMKGNYATANGGFIPNGLKSLVGCPITDFLSEDQTSATAASDVWTVMKAADDLDYILASGTIG